MGEKGKIFLGLAIFVILITFPFWSRLAAAGDAPSDRIRDDLEYPADEEVCVEDTEYMRASHMDLLNQWRDELVRDGDPEFRSPLTGQRFQKSLTKTCLSCHEDRDAFCTRCHDYADVQPTCWECHTTPGGGV
jgi:hypothetical protein